MSRGYGAISCAYDSFNGEVDYAAWADFAERCFDTYLPARPSLVLDLACGTGTLTELLSERGYDMTGVDASPEMLSVARERCSENTLLLCQNMCAFELYGTVGATICSLDSLNHLTRKGELEKCFSLVHNYLDPDGLFLFDMNTPYRFCEVYGDHAYILEDEMEDEQGNKKEIYCGWQNAYDPQTKLCQFYLSLFEQNADGSFTRADEVQTERCYEFSEIKAALDRAGFEFLGVWADFDFTAPTERTERWYFAARAKKNT